MSLSYTLPTVRASGATFAQFQAAGLTGQIDRLITANAAALANPTTQATATATGGGSTGGLLAAGSYYLSYTFTNGIGETTAGTSESAVLSVSATNIPRVTLPALPTGATAINLYVTAASGATGSEVLYAQGITATTYDLAVAAPASTVTPPAANTTALSTAQQALLRRFHGVGAGLQSISQEFAMKLDNWLHGLPVPDADIRQQVADYAAVFGVLAKAANEIGTLVYANMGTLGTGTNARGDRVAVRTWP